MNWGTKILMLYLAFVGLIVTLVVTCLNNDTELEYKDYYARELKFQDQINAQRNTLNLSVPINHEVHGRTVEITLPQELLNDVSTGNIHFMRPSDSKLDKTIELKINEQGKQVIADDDFQKGIYKMKISIENAGKSYFKESVINFK